MKKILLLSVLVLNSSYLFAESSTLLCRSADLKISIGKVDNVSQLFLNFSERVEAEFEGDVLNTGEKEAMISFLGKQKILFQEEATFNCGLETNFKIFEQMVEIKRKNSASFFLKVKCREETSVSAGQNEYTQSCLDE